MRLSSRPLGMLVLAAALLAPGAASAACVQCDSLYGSDPSGNFWILDPDAGTATWIGNLPFPMLLDVAISSSGEMYGLAEDELKRIDTCSAPFSSVQVELVGGNSLGGDPAGPNLHVIGAPPMAVYDTIADSLTYVGGSLGTDPPDWCGIASGDIAFDQADGLLYATLSCPECASGDMLVTIDPATGRAVSEIGCIQDASGTGYAGLWGLAFDGSCRLFASPAFGGFVLEIDPSTAVATNIPLVGFSDIGDPFNGAWGLASLPCGPCGGGAPAACEPRDHGWWHRECLGAGLVDPGRRGRGRGPDGSSRSTTYPATTFAAADAAMAPHGVLACEALDEGSFSDARLAALRELATLHLDLAAGFLDPACPVELRPVVDADGLVVADAVALIESRLASGSARDLREARWIGAHVVDGEAMTRP